MVCEVDKISHICLQLADSERCSSVRRAAVVRHMFGELCGVPMIFLHNTLVRGGAVCGTCSRARSGVIGLWQTHLLLTPLPYPDPGCEL